MLEKLFTPHINNLGNALSRTTYRQSLLTKNLANVNTPGYKREDTDFAIQLENEQNRGLRGLRGMAELQGSQASLRIDGNSVDLEQEVVSMAENQQRFEVISNMTAGYFTGLKSAIREGK